MTRGAGQAGDRADTKWDLPRGWRGPTLHRPLSTLPTIRQVEKLVEGHGHRVAELTDTISSGHHQPGVSSTHEIAIRVDEDALTRAAEEVLALLRSGVVPSAMTELADAHAEEENNLLGDAIHQIGECFDLIASSRLATAKVVSAINAAYECQTDLLTSLHQLGAIDRIAFSSYSKQLKYDFNAAKLELARRWLEHGRDEVDIGKVTKRLYRDVPGAAAVAAEIATITDAARDSGRLGNHPKTGDPVFVKVGANGRVYVQLGRRSDSAQKRAMRIELPDRIRYAPSDGWTAVASSSRGKEKDPRDVTLETALELIDRKLARLRPWGIDPESGRPIFLKTGPYGLYLQLGRTIPAGGSGNIVRVSAPPHVDMGSLTPQDASQLLHRRMKQDLPLGRDPETSHNVYIKDGNFGPYVQLGERRRNGPRVKIVELPTGLDPDEMDLQGALEVLRRVVLRELGPHPETGAIVTVQTEGRFGPFVSCQREHATVPERFNPMDVTLEDAVRFLDAKRELTEWRRETRIEFSEAVSPPGLYEWLGQMAEMDVGSTEKGKSLAERRAEYYAGLTEAERADVLDRIEAIHTRLVSTPVLAHARGNITDEALERAVQYLDERFEEARRAVVGKASSR